MWNAKIKAQAPTAPELRLIGKCGSNNLFPDKRHTAFNMWRGDREYSTIEFPNGVPFAQIIIQPLYLQVQKNSAA